MCCWLAVLAMVGPRVTIILWWFLKPSYFSSTFTTILWPLLGFLFLPWVTLIYLLVAPGGINGFDLIWLGVALIVDLSAYGGSIYNHKNRIDAK